MHSKAGRPSRGSEASASSTGGEAEELGPQETLWNLRSYMCVSIAIVVVTTLVGSIASAISTRESIFKYQQNVNVGR